MSQRKDRSTVEAEVLARAARDSEFRQALLADAPAALNRTFGIKLPSDVKLHVVEESSANRYLVLPASSDGKLSDEELDAVSGGSDYSYTCTGGCN
jgi:hypothetical protein